MLLSEVLDLELQLPPIPPEVKNEDGIKKFFGIRLLIYGIDDFRVSEELYPDHVVAICNIKPSQVDQYMEKLFDEFPKYSTKPSLFFHHPIWQFTMQMLPDLDIEKIYSIESVWRMQPRDIDD